MNTLSIPSRCSGILARVTKSRILPAAPILTFNRTFYRSKKDSGAEDMIKSAPLWRAQNATESEQDVKADREPLPPNMHAIQRESIEAFQAENQTHYKFGPNADRQ
ncbi:hypothetical protein FBU30_007259 [Linnemannia zychae]|nr:hypothetical protein FBU30_007259 [Linnemannia zychae]